MENAQYLHVSIVSHEVCNSKVPVQDDADISRGVEIPVAYFRILRENLGAIVDALDGA